jgi:hypothetical protein
MFFCRSLFFVTDASDTIASAAVVDSVAMPLRARYTFALAPVVRD